MKYTAPFYDMENSSDHFYKKLGETETPGRILAAMYCSYYDIQVTKKEVIMCNKLVGFFGRTIVFFSILRMVGSYPEVPENPYPLLYAICNRRFEESHIGDTVQSRESLGNYIADIDRQLEKIKKQKPKIPPAEGLKK